jgi:hypothetical protein
LVVVIALGQPLKMIWVTGPGPVGLKELLADEESMGETELAVMVYCVPTTPAKVQFATLMRPAADVKFAQLASVPPDVVKLTVTDVVVATLPWESSTMSTGCMAN